MKSIFSLVGSVALFLLPACGPSTGQAWSPSSGGSGYGNRSHSSNYLASGNLFGFGDSAGDDSSSIGASSRTGSGRGYSPATTYSSDYTAGQTLGGNTRVSDRWGNSTTYDQTLGGGLRSTSNTGQTMNYSQNLGGGYEARSGGGTTYRSNQTLGGGTRIEGSDGSSYQRTQTLGGGYRYDAR